MDPCLFFNTSMTICNTKIGTTCPFYLAWSWKIRSLTCGSIGHRLPEIWHWLPWEEDWSTTMTLTPKVTIVKYRAPSRLSIALSPPSEESSEIRKRERVTERQIGPYYILRQTDRQTERQADIQTDRQTTNMIRRLETAPNPGRTSPRPHHAVPHGYRSFKTVTYTAR